MKSKFLTIFLFITCSISTLKGTAYYISAAGNDNNSGTTTSAPYKTLAKISTKTLLPGDYVYFNKGDRFDGHFVVKGSGTAAQPITITAYGTGAKPIITGEVGAAGGGDYQEAIMVNNYDNMVFDGLEIHNERLVTRSGINDSLSYGIYILNNGTTVKSNFTFRNMTFQNVYAVAPITTRDNFDALEVAGLRFFSSKNTVAGQEKNIQNILVENCYFTDLQRFGVHIKHGGGNAGIGNESINRNMDVVCRNNEFHYIGGTCILPQQTYNCLIENNIFDHPGDNSDPRMPNRGSSVWTYRCYNTVIQYNQCLSTRGYLDSHGIHIDHENVNTFIQYNFMKDCEGGFVEILGGNTNAVYRFNVSVNDGWRESPTWANSNHTIWIDPVASNLQVIPSDGCYIYNNTIFMDWAYSTAIAINAYNTHIFNNIFYTINGGNIGGKQASINALSTPTLYMRNNLFFGTVSSTFKNYTTVANTNQTGNPNFANGSAYEQPGYRITAASGAINKGVAKQGPPIPGAGTGIFINVPEYPNVDIYGNPIDMSSGTPNIGADNTKTGIVPITLMEFKGFRQGQSNHLTWKTSTEINNVGFDIERSANGLDFTKWLNIASKSKNGNSNTLLEYKVEDNTPLSIMTYYRLKQNDFDGKYTYSPIISIQNNTRKGRLDVFPNPIKDRTIDIQTDIDFDAATTVSVYDIRGQMVLQQALLNAKIKLPPSVSAGIYVLKVTNSKTQSVVQTKFIVD